MWRILLTGSVVKNGMTLQAGVNFPTILNLGEIVIKASQNISNKCLDVVFLFFKCFSLQNENRYCFKFTKVSLRVLRYIVKDIT